MPEYIEREPLLAEYDRKHKGPPGRARGLIANAPAADVVPVRHGKWEVNPVYIKCSECGEAFMLIPQNYCPNCGADMRTGVSRE